MDNSDIGNNLLAKYLGGRKFVIVILALVFSSVLLWFGKLEGGLYSTMNISVILGFITGNVYESINRK